VDVGVEDDAVSEHDLRAWIKAIRDLAAEAVQAEIDAQAPAAPDGTVRFRKPAEVSVALDRWANAASALVAEVRAGDRMLAAVEAALSAEAARREHPQYTLTPEGLAVLARGPGR
jgi:hypothetical protein